MIDLVIAEDQSMLNSALATILNLEDDITVVGTATEGKQAWQLIQDKQPDLALLDIEMPGLTGLEIASQLQVAQLKTKALILTTFARQSYFEAAVQANVGGYLLKDSPTDDLVTAIRAVMAGQTVYAPELVRGMLRADHNPLTKREQSVLAAAATGANTKQIAEMLFLSPGTVRNYFSAILSKLAASNRIEALNIARQNGWLD